tara:strand:- start:2445 stop:3035 length:591 start_codon:yes stop_codon:yes gene_type:complete
MEIIFEFDKDLLIFLNSTGTHRFDQFWLIVTNKYTHIPLYFFLLYLSFKKLKNRQNLNKKKLIKIYLFFIFSVIFLIFISDQLSNLFKYSFQRLRPCHDEQIQSLIRIVKQDCGGLYSFFSAHASNSFVVASIFFLFLKDNKWYYLLFIWACLVAYSRIYLGVHFPLDIIVGSMIGILISFLFYKLIFIKILNRFI